MKNLLARIRADWNGFVRRVEHNLQSPLRAAQVEALKQIMRSLEEGKSVWLWGGTGVGKSSLVRAFMYAQQQLDPVLQESIICLVYMEDLVAKVKANESIDLLQTYKAGSYIFDDVVRESEVNLKLYGEPARLFPTLLTIRFQLWEQDLSRPCICTSNHSLQRAFIQNGGVYQDTALARRAVDYFTEIQLTK
jgi:energy-coupling factor transporter ATP-binding protein EcfA2